MNDSPRTVPPRFRGLFRAGLLALGAVQAIDGLYALLAPRSFYDDFPLGRGWLAALPDYSEHLVRDVGGLFLGTAVVLIAAGIFLERRLVWVALLSFLAFSLPHSIFHAFNLEPYAAGDVIANLLALGATVVIPVLLLFLLGRPEEREGAATAATGSRPPAHADSAAAGRIAGVPESTRNPMVRYAYRQSRKQGEGKVMDPIRVFAHHPLLLGGYGAFEMATERAHRVPERLKHLAGLRASMLCGCEWCLDYGSAISMGKEVSEDDLRALPDYAGGGHFDELERLVIEYASGISATPVDVSDELFAALRERLDEAQLVELTNAIAIENYRARFYWAFGIAGQGYSEGSYCLRPAGAGAES